VPLGVPGGLKHLSPNWADSRPFGGGQQPLAKFRQAASTNRGSARQKKEQNCF